jgi:hypothetical protein
MSDQNSIIQALKIPGRVFALPSKGIFYKNGELHPDVKNGEVQVFPMSGLAEMKFHSPDLLYSGKAVIEVISECVPSVLKPGDLLSRDIDAIFAFIRLVTYGNIVECNHMHTCANAKTHTYDVDIEQIVNSISYIPDDHFKLFFNVTLPNNQILELKPLSWKDSVTVMQITSFEKVTSADVDKLYITQNSGIIMSIDGVINRELIEEWTKIAKGPFMKIINDSVNNGMDGWGPSFSAKKQCKDCGEEIEVNVNLDPSSFFSQ